ncbi:hypothetical protein NKG94_30925 [Micromonospora sp. M12]
MGICSHDGKLYEITSGYSLPDDAWQYELVGLTGPPGTGPYLSVSIPDATLDGPFTPRPTEHVVVCAGGGTVPWPVLEKLVHLLDTSGDLVDERRDLSPEATALPCPATPGRRTTDGSRSTTSTTATPDRGATSCTRSSRRPPRTTTSTSWSPTPHPSPGPSSRCRPSTSR